MVKGKRKSQTQRSPQNPCVQQWGGPCDSPLSTPWQNLLSVTSVPPTPPHLLLPVTDVTLYFSTLHLLWCCPLSLLESPAGEPCK